MLISCRFFWLYAGVHRQHLTSQVLWAAAWPSHMCMPCLSSRWVSHFVLWFYFSWKLVLIYGMGIEFKIMNASREWNVSRVSLQDFDTRYITLCVSHVKCISVVWRFSLPGGWGWSPTSQKFTHLSHLEKSTQ